MTDQKQTDTESEQLIRKLRASITFSLTEEEIARNTARNIDSIVRSLQCRGDLFADNDVLALRHDDGSVLKIPVESLPQTIGGGPSADQRLESESVSGLHCTLVREKPFVSIVDGSPAGRESKNGTCLNGPRIGKAYICVGDELKLADITFVVCRE